MTENNGKAGDPVVFKAYAGLILWHDRLKNKQERKGFKEALRALDTILTNHGPDALLAIGLASSTVWGLKPYPEKDDMLANKQKLDSIFDRFKKCLDYHKNRKKEQIINEHLAATKRAGGGSARSLP